MTITAKNYAAQAEYGLIKSKHFLTSKEHQNVQQDISGKIKDCVHFAIEDGGEIFNDDYKAIKGTKINLPFDKITIEWYENTIDNFKSDRSVSTKKIAIAHQYEHIIKVYSCAYLDDYDCWFAMPFCSSINCDWEIGSELKNEDTNIMTATEILAESNIDINAGLGDMGNAVIAVMELVEALSCKNVEQTVYQEVSKTNAQRIKSGKLPIYETKILTIKASEPKLSKQGISTGTHASPRQHLRRGHIRRLETSNIWVNACVVGNKENGIINKSYNVR